MNLKNKRCVIEKNSTDRFYKTQGKKQSGFTLIELMISLVVTVIIIGGYIGANIIIQQNMEVRYESTIAIQDANRVLEQIRNTAQDGTFPDNVVTAFPNDGEVADFDNLNLTDETITISYENDDTAADPLDITITVTWQSQSERTLSTTLRAMVTQR